VAAKIDIKTSDSVLTSSNSPYLEIPIELTEPVSQIETIELVTNDGVIKGRLDRSKRSLIFNIPYGINSLKGELRIIEVGGRSYVVKNIDYELEHEKFLNFSEIITNELRGNLSCKLQLKSVDGLGGRLLYEAMLDSEESCRVICGSIGPLTYSSMKKVECGTSGLVFYESQIN
jgi:hypothetical protein